MENSIDGHQALVLSNAVDHDIRQARDDPLQCALEAAGMAHERKAAESLGTFENAMNYGIRRTWPVASDPGVYPIKVVVGGLADDNFHARLRAKRAWTSSRVRNLGFGSASRRSNSATCSSVSRTV